MGKCIKKRIRITSLALIHVHSPTMGFLIVKVTQPCLTLCDPMEYIVGRGGCWGQGRSRSQERVRLLKGIGCSAVACPSGSQLLSRSQLDGGLPEGGAAFPSGAGGEPPERSAAGQAGPLFRTLCGSLEEDL